MRVLHTVFKVLFVLMGHPQVTSSHHRSIGFKTPGLILDDLGLLPIGKLHKELVALSESDDQALVQHRW